MNIYAFASHEQISFFYIFKYNISQYYRFTVFFWSQKCSIDEHKHKKYLKNSYRPQTFEHYCGFILTWCSVSQLH